MRTAWMAATVATLAVAAPVSMTAQVAASEMAQEQGDVAAAVEAVNEAWMSAYNAGDAAGVAAAYAEDATVMAPNMEPAVGLDAIQASMQAALDAAPGFSVTLETSSLDVTGDTAIEIGRYVVSDADGGHADHGSYMAHWKRIDGAWKIAADIWNSSMAGM